MACDLICICIIGIAVGPVVKCVVADTSNCYITQRINFCIHIVASVCLLRSCNNFHYVTVYNSHAINCTVTWVLRNVSEYYLVHIRDTVWCFRFFCVCTNLV